jgi:hypothetical protein
MKFKVIYNPEVYDDIQQAVDWYNEQKPDLGKHFYTTTKNHLNSLKSSALHFAIRYDDIHCMKIKKFPYMTHYRVDMDKKIVKVEAVLSTDRSPRIWKKRTK